MNKLVWVKKSLHATCGFLTFFHQRLRILNQFFTHLHSEAYKNYTLLTGTITLQNYSILWWFLAYRCMWEYPITCLFDSLCKIENWEPAYQICYWLLKAWFRKVKQLKHVYVREQSWFRKNCLRSNRNVFEFCFTNNSNSFGSCSAAANVNKYRHA